MAATSAGAAAEWREMPMPPLTGVGDLLGGGLDEHVQRHVQVHRPRAPAEHNGERLAEHQRQLVGAGRLEAALDVGP